MTNSFAKVLWVTGAAIALAAGGASRAAGATAPTAAPSSAPSEISGRIDAIVGKYGLRLRDDRGYIDSVTLHQGTVIVPAGLTLKSGMLVKITGSASGTTFSANVIRTSYSVPSPRAGFSASGCTAAANANPNTNPLTNPNVVSGPPGPPFGSC